MKLVPADHPLHLAGFCGRVSWASALLKYFPGMVVGISGTLTFTKMKPILAELAFDLPLDQLIFETHGPRVPPTTALSDPKSSRDAFSHPKLVWFIAQQLAEVKKGPSAEELLQASWANVQRIYSIAS